MSDEYRLLEVGERVHGTDEYLNSRGVWCKPEIEGSGYFILKPHHCKRRRKIRTLNTFDRLRRIEEKLGLYNPLDERYIP